MSFVPRLIQKLGVLCLLRPKCGQRSRVLVVAVDSNLCVCVGRPLSHWLWLLLVVARRDLIAASKDEALPVLYGACLLVTP